MMTAVLPEDDCDAADRRARQLGALAELGEIGMQIARALRDQVVASAAAGPEAPRGLPGFDPGLAFSRVARAVRLTFALENRFASDAVEASRETRIDAVRDGFWAQRMRATARQDAVGEIIERGIRAQARAGGLAADAESLIEDLHERIDEDEELDWGGDQPIGEQVAWICRQLRVPFDPDLWAGFDQAGFRLDGGAAVGGPGAEGAFDAETTPSPPGPPPAGWRGFEGPS